MLSHKDRERGERDRERERDRARERERVKGGSRRQKGTKTCTRMDAYNQKDTHQTGMNTWTYTMTNTYINTTQHKNACTCT
jgi:hypothetical protein